MNQTQTRTMEDMEMSQVEEEVEPTSNNLIPSSSQPHDDVAFNFLSLARQLVHQGQPSQALQAVVMAMKTKGGEEAVLYVLQRARELYRSRLQASAEADQLASLFAECAIAEAQPAGNQPPSSVLPSPTESVAPVQIQPDACGKSILAETGRQQIVLNAFSDGSSFICLRCGGLVSKHRKDEHYAYWCEF